MPETDDVLMPTWQQLRERVGELNPREYAGIPVPVEDARLVVAQGHPYYDRLNGKSLADEEPEESGPELHQVNCWHRNGEDVYLWREGDDPKTRHAALPNGPGVRLDALIKCVGISVTMDLEAENRALATLAMLIKPHLFKAYMLTGSFIETSPASGVCYLFRRLGTTIAIGTRAKAPRFLAALCLHPIAYYDGLPMGAMTPTDDVIAHLVMMRADEHLFWRKANQHTIDSPGAML